MKRGSLQTSPVQQMMAENPTNWWNSAAVGGARPPLLPPLPNSLHQGPPPSTAPLLPNPTSSSMIHPYPPSSSILFLQNPPCNNQNQEFPDSWSQLLLGGFVGEEERGCYAKKIDDWEDQILQIPSASTEMVDVKEQLDHGYVFSPNQNDRDQHHGRSEEYHTAWPPINHHPVSSPNSCVTGYSSNILDFSVGGKPEKKHQPPEQSLECHSSATAGAALKKPRVQATAPVQAPFKVRKEKLGDRITALHQLVSPFGKTDTASVLLEAIGYIKFLQGQIAALSSPYMAGNAPGNPKQQAKSKGRGCIFPEDSGQLFNESCLKRKATSEQVFAPKAENEAKKDLRSRGLCLVPLSCTLLHVGSNQVNGSDFLAASAKLTESVVYFTYNSHLLSLGKLPIHLDDDHIAS